MSRPITSPLQPNPGWSVLPPSLKICQASVCFANQDAKRRFEEANNCIFIKDPCEHLKENQCCGKDPKTRGKLAVDKQAQTINKNFDWQQYQKMCPEMKQNEAETDALWRQCRVGQKHDPQDDYPIQIVEKNGNARTYCIDGCSTPPGAVSSLYRAGIIMAKDKDTPSGYPQASFLSACVDHDICYQTCATNQKQDNCDLDLKRKALNSCENIPKDHITNHPFRGAKYTFFECLSAASAYYEGLKLGGAEAYKKRK